MNLKFNHVALRPTAENFDRTMDFYTKVLGFKIAREWTSELDGVMTRCAMIDVKNGVTIEIFGNGQAGKNLGTIPHFAFETDDVEACLKKCRDNNYRECSPEGMPVENSMIDLVFTRDPFFAMKIGFVIGACGEIVEFIQNLSKNEI